MQIHQSFIDKFEAEEKRIFEVPEIEDVSKFIIPCFKYYDLIVVEGKPFGEERS